MTKHITDIFADTFNKAYEKKLLEMVKGGKIPHHLAIIMDGNRRYAESRGDPPIMGHEYGREKLKELLQWCLDLDIKVLTVYAFSTENFNRTAEEVNTLMNMFAENFYKFAEDEKVMEYGIRLRVLGDPNVLPKTVRESIENAVEKTKGNENYSFNMAVGYGGREEITNAMKKIARDIEAKKIKVEDIDKDLISSHLYTHDLPDPDLILRTSGEVRLSNFLLWQLAYSEFYFTDVYWPGFTKIEFLRAIHSYQLRLRRFGK